MKAHRILVIDDEPMIVTLINDVLTTDGYEVNGVGDGDEALGRLKEAKYDAVLMDVRMPRMGGVELYRRMIESYPEIMGRIIISTGDLGTKETRHFIELTGAPYLFKPFGIKELKEIVEKTITGDRGTGG